MRVEEAIGRQISRLRARRQLSLTDLGEALGQYLGKPWSRQAVHQAERGQRSFTAAELTALALALDASVPTLFRADDEPIELPGRAVSAQEYRGVLLNRDPEAPLDGVEEMIVALHDIGEVLARPALAQLARIGRAAEQAARPDRREDTASLVRRRETAGLNDDDGPTIALRACGWKCTGVTRARQHCRSRSGGRDPVTE